MLLAGCQKDEIGHYRVPRPRQPLTYTTPAGWDDLGPQTIKTVRSLATFRVSDGERSANVTGEVMVEVGSGKQQLKTPWAQRQATHAEAGSEIHRDEVPLMYQQFVQQYFEEIRKTPPASKNPSKQ